MALSPEESILMREEHVRELRRVYRRAQFALRRILAEMEGTDFRIDRANRLLAQVDRVARALDQEGTAWARGALPEVYAEGVDFASAVMESQGLSAGADLGAQVHTRAVDALVRRAAADVAGSAESVRTGFRRFIRRSQQLVLSEGEVNRDLAQAIIQGETRKVASDRLLVRFMKRMDAGQFIEAGRYHFTPEYYSELVARTRIIEASSDATLALNEEFGNDLVQVSRHSGVDPSDDLCWELQGRVFATADDDPDFPPLRHVPPFHPHCRHVLLPVLREFLRERGTLEAHKRLSASPAVSVDTPEDFRRAILGEAA